MNPQPLDERISPLNAAQAQQANDLIRNLEPDQALWLSGYLAGVNARATARPAPPAAAAARQLTVLYASQTGNARGVAEQAAAAARQQGFAVTVEDVGHYRPRDLKKERHLLLVASTHGEGEPPDNAVEFHEFLHAERAPRLDGLDYSVLALGDSSYDHYCQVGRDFDTALALLGARRVHDRVDCDVDYEAAAGQWIEAAVEAFKARAPDGPQVASVTTLFPASEAAAARPRYDKQHPFEAEILEDLVLSGRGSTKSVRHVVLDQEGSGLTFEPGDAIGVVPQNDPALVDRLLDALELDPAAAVGDEPGATGLRDALLADYDITTLTRPLLENYAALADADPLRRLLDEERRPELAAYTAGRDLLDLVRDHPPGAVDATAWVRLLRKLPPRLYSIASSPRANPDEVHLTVAEVRYRSHGRDRAGVASGHLAGRVGAGDRLPVYVHANPNFRLPASGDTPLIMIGPGTGVAPFRAFVEERQALGQPGKSWLFFGDRNFRTDFLYQAEWQRWLKEGALTRMDVAFSRDQAERIHVQQRMLEHAKDLYGWLQEGAHLYICGDAERMAPDVHRTLQRIVQQAGGLSAEGAADYVRQLQRDRRYQRDVY
jgi:sulfite reductase (NADPH) flavoprotein alpha-component